MTRSLKNSHGKTPITHRATALGASPKSNPAPSADLLEKPSDEPKLSRKRPGHWRNMWRSETGWSYELPGEITIDAFTRLAPRKYPSRELAEEFATEAMRENFAPGGMWERGRRHIRYLGARFIPDDS